MSRKIIPAPAYLDFLAPSLSDEQRKALTVSASVKVPVICSSCHREQLCTFFSAYRQRIKNGRYVCRRCQAKENGKFASKGFEQRKRTNLRKFGVEHPMQLPQVQQKCYNAGGGWSRVHREGLNHTPDVQARQREHNLSKYGVPYTTLLPQCQQTITERKTSKAESDVRDYLQSITGREWASNWTCIAPKQLDGYDAGSRTAFEYCGLFWHSDATHKSRLYHLDKLERCERQGIRLFTIFEDEWMNRREQVQGIFAASLGIYRQRVGARTTSVRTITASDAHQALNAWHLQGASTATTHAFGLFHEQTLVGVMTFRPHHRLVNSPRMILSRMAFAPGWQVIGGASKLFHAAIPHLPPATPIISWSDRRWSQGRVYRQMGFQQDAILPPDYSYVNGQRRIPKQACTRKALRARDGQTEYDRARELGYVRIWDCGKVRWTYRTPNC